MPHLCRGDKRPCFVRFRERFSRFLSYRIVMYKTAHLSIGRSRECDSTSTPHSGRSHHHTDQPTELFLRRLLGVGSIATHDFCQLVSDGRERFYSNIDAPAAVLSASCISTTAKHYTQSEVTSHSLWSRHGRHFVGITRHNVWSEGAKISCVIQN